MTKPTNADLRNVFDVAASAYDDVTNSYAVSRRKEFFVQNAEGDCLEVGAGTGEISKALVSVGHRVVATDVSSKMVEEIKKKLSIDAFVCDAERLPFVEASFDTVVGAEMIYYLDNPEHFVREAYRVLKPKGLFLLSSANSVTKIYHYIRTVLRKLGVSHMYFDDPVYGFPSAKKLCTLLEQGGFRVVELRKIMPAPFGIFHRFNLIAERTPLKHFGVFMLVVAKKKS